MSETRSEGNERKMEKTTARDSSRTEKLAVPLDNIADALFLHREVAALGARAECPVSYHLLELIVQLLLLRFHGLQRKRERGNTSGVRKWK